jgi:fucose permease
MEQKGFFKQKIGHQTLSGLVTLGAFPFLYIGGTKNINSLMYFGILLIILGMVSAPVITYMHGWNSDEAKEEAVEEKQ